MIRRTTWRWMALVLVLAMVLTGCQPVQQAGPGGDAADMAGEEVVIAVGIEPVSLDAWRSFAGTGGPGFRNAVEQLINRDFTTGEFVPTPGHILGESERHHDTFHTPGGRDLPRWLSLQR